MEPNSSYSIRSFQISNEQLNEMMKQTDYYSLYSNSFPAVQIQKDIEQFHRAKEEKERRQINALETTASNTEEANRLLNTVVDNQNDYIRLLKEQVNSQQRQISIMQSQLDKINALFASEEDGVEVEKEIMRLIQTQIDAKHPLWEFVKDKGGDIAAHAIIQEAPIIYNAIKMLLAAKGIILP